METFSEFFSDQKVWDLRSKIMLREMGRYLRAWFYISSPLLLQFSTKYLIENIFESTTNVMMFLLDPPLKFRGMNIH